MLLTGLTLGLLLQRQKLWGRMAWWLQAETELLVQSDDLGTAVTSLVVSGITSHSGGEIINPDQGLLFANVENGK